MEEERTHLTQINIMGVGSSVAAPVETWIMALVSLMPQKDIRALFYTVEQIEISREMAYDVGDEFNDLPPREKTEEEEPNEQD